jgi:hypothetical protein
MSYSYEITPRPIELGGGSRLRLLESEKKMGSGVFPVDDSDADAGMRWWNKCNEQERAHWLTMAVSARPADAYHAFMLAETYADAESTAYEWLDSRENNNE